MTTKHKVEILADELNKLHPSEPRDYRVTANSAIMLRKQQAEIDALQARIKELESQLKLNGCMT